MPDLQSREGPESHGSHELPRPFSLTRGGPFFLLARALGLTRDGAPGIAARTVLAITIGFVPLAVLAALQGVLVGDRVSLPLLYDLTAWARFALATPLLIQAEKAVGARLALGIAHLRTSDVLEDEGKSDLEVAVTKTERARDAVLPEILLALLALTSAWLSNHTAANLPVSSWLALVPHDSSTATWAGMWLHWVSMPLYTFLLLRWLWRILLWTGLLMRVSRSKMRLIPTHPDRAAGLAFLGEVHVAFGTIIMPVAASVAARGVQWVQLGGFTLEGLRNAVIAFVVITLAIVIGPLLIFMPKLFLAKRRGLFEYAGLATEYTRAFDQKWVRRTPPPSDPLLGTADVQSLADLSNSFQIIEQMRVVPPSRRNLVSLLLATLLPMLPFLLAILPMEEILKQLAQLVMR